MNHYTTYTDNLDRRGFISKESILSLVSQEEIYQLVFGYLPEDSQYVTSPLRKDKTPGAYFTKHINGTLYFVDWGSPRTHSDCFNVIQDYFGLPNFYTTLDYIHKSLILGRVFEPKDIVLKERVEPKKRPGVKIIIEARPFYDVDRDYWSQYEIKKSDLIEDRVFPVKKYYALNTKKGDITTSCRDICYSYNEFENSRKKLYFPRKVDRNRFISNCNRNDVGGIKLLAPVGETLIITKGYKDYRVLKNHGKNAIWFQNEGSLPDMKILKNVLSSYRKVIVWYDNDEPGITASEKVKNYINTEYPGKARNLWLPEKGLELGIKDPSDAKAKDNILFQQFLKAFT